MVNSPSALPVAVLILALLCVMFCPVVHGQEMGPSPDQVSRFLASDNTTKALVFTKLYILEHATKENGNFKFTFPLIQITVKKDGEVITQALSPATIFIGTTDLNLEYEVQVAPMVSVAITQDDTWKYPTLFVGGVLVGFAAGYFIRGIQ